MKRVASAPPSHRPDVPAMSMNISVKRRPLSDDRRPNFTAADCSESNGNATAAGDVHQRINFALDADTSHKHEPMSADFHAKTIVALPYANAVEPMKKCHY